MYKERINLDRFKDRLGEVIHLVCLIMHNSNGELQKEDVEKISTINDKLKNKDVYTLLEVIYTSSQIFNDNVIKELEDKFTHLVFKWADMIKECDTVTLEFNVNLHYWLIEINERMETSIDSINRFCVNYLSIPESNLFTANDYYKIAIAHKDYLKANQRYYELKHNGVNALTNEDHSNMHLLELHDEAQYVENLLEEGVPFDISTYGFDFEDLKRFEQVVKQDEFNVYFVTRHETFDVNITENQMFAIYNYLNQNNFIDAEWETFKYAITKKILPDYSPEILWKKPRSKADAWRLMEYLAWDTDTFNTIFKFPVLKPLTTKANKPKENDTSNFMTFLEKL